jgi:hypothetical protein
MHTISGSLADVGSGMGGLFGGMATVPISTAIMKYGAEPVKGALKRAGKEVAGKKTKKKTVKKGKKKKR